MKSNYLVLPFFDDVAKTSLFQRQGYNTSLSTRFKVYSKFDRLLPFVCEVGPDCTFQVVVRDLNGEVCGSISEKQLKHKIYEKGGKNYIVYGGERIGCLELGDCQLPYNIQIGKFYSEWFWVADSTDKLIKIELGNSTDFKQIPYSIGFKQFFYIESTIGTPEVDSFSVTSRDARGNTQTTYQRLIETYNFYCINVPPHVKNVINSMEVLDSVSINSSGERLVSEEKQTKVKSKRNEGGFEFYDVEFSVTNKEFEEVDVCEVSTFKITPCAVEFAEELECFGIDAIETVAVTCETTTPVTTGVTPPTTVTPTDKPIFYATVTY